MAAAKAPAGPLIALLSCRAAIGRDDDMALLQNALAELGAESEVWYWDDGLPPAGRFALAVLRSTWDYAQRPQAFLDFCQGMATRTRLVNPLATVAWNCDKRYLAELGRHAVPIVPSSFIAPGQYIDLPDCADGWAVKPVIGAGARGARRFAEHARDEAKAHALGLMSAGSHVLVQPYQRAVDLAGETALVYVDGTFSHAVRKAALLRAGDVATPALFAAETISKRRASSDERAVADAALAALPKLGIAAPVYARVDLLPSEVGPRLVELELIEPSLFLAHGSGAAERFANALLARLAPTASA